MSKVYNPMLPMTRVSFGIPGIFLLRDCDCRRVRRDGSPRLRAGALPLCADDGALDVCALLLPELFPEVLRTAEWPMLACEGPTDVDRSTRLSLDLLHRSWLLRRTRRLEGAVG
eukprot:1182705-Prorocentrum_minimum.AAC.4